MNYSAYTQQFFEQPCFSNEFPGYDKCLTGYGVASVLGLSPWEDRSALFQRLTGPKKPFKMTWEMKRGMDWKNSVFEVVAKNSTAFPIRYNPFMANQKLYVSSNTLPGVGGMVDAFLIDRETLDVTAGLTVRTAGLSSAAYWKKRLAPGHAAQNLFYMGLCGGIRWVVSVMFFCVGADGQESEPWEVRSYVMNFDEELYHDIFQEAKNFWENGIETDEKRLESLRQRIKEYADTKTGVVRFGLPVDAE